MKTKIEFTKGFLVEDNKGVLKPDLRTYEDLHTLKGVIQGRRDKLSVLTFSNSMKFLIETVKERYKVSIVLDEDIFSKKLFSSKSLDEACDELIIRLNTNLSALEKI